MIFDSKVRVGYQLSNKCKIICLAHIHAEELTIMLLPSKSDIKFKSYFLSIIVVQKFLSSYLKNTV